MTAKELIYNMDWESLRKQYGTLIDKIVGSDTEDAEDIECVLTLIDDIQRIAVSEFEVPRNLVYGLIIEK